MIYFCIPTHNEEKTVGIVLWKLRQVMAAFPRDYQILVGEDASTDKSAEILDPYRRVIPLVVMRNAERRGYAATLEMLLREAVRRSKYPRRDAIVVLRADFTEDPDFAAALLKRLESGADIAAGGPVADARRRPFLDRLARAWARRSLRRFEWPPDADPLSGFRAYRLTTIKRAIEEAKGKRLLRWDGVAANAALLRAALPHARRVETAELMSHPERAQRTRRTARLQLIREVNRFASGVEAEDLLSADALVPAEVIGDLSVLHGPESNGHAETEAAVVQPRRRRDSEHRGRRTGPRRENGERKRQRSEHRDRTRKTATHEAKTAGGEVPGERPPAEPRAERRSRRGRRGGSPRRRRPETMSAAGDVAQPPVPEPGVVIAGSEEAGTPPGSQGSVVEGVEITEDRQDRPARRRRGRRGGKGRRGGRRQGGTVDATHPLEQAEDVKQLPRPESET